MSKERSFYKNVVCPPLFQLDPETAHNYTRAVLGLAERSRIIRDALTKVFSFEDPALNVELWGLRFKNPVGLAAGFDKRGDIVLATATLGFGHIEVGAVTHFPQLGNPRPRIFRLVDDHAAINRMGMNNPGAEKIARNLEGSRKERTIPVGVNIASSTEATDATGNSLKTLQEVYPMADYIVLNVSCPNVEGHLDQQQREFFRRFANRVGRVRQILVRQYDYRPILPKISPDLTEQEIDNVLRVIQDAGLDGIIATNTTLRKEGLISPYKDKMGGLSGQPLRQRSTEIIAYIHQQVPDLPIIGVGGIETAEDAWEKLQAGASLVQVFTGMIYEGPFIVKNINQRLAELMESG